MLTKKTNKTTTKEKTYSKSAFVDAEKNSKERLLLQTLLNDGESYTKSEAAIKVNEWKNTLIKEVKS